jgi:two-component system, chemotaxis family, chemotaxis protein CheY
LGKENVWQGSSVLIVDDHDKECEDLSIVYKRLGFEVCGFAKNGLEALQVYEEKKPDLVSLDIVMPIMHGIECYHELKKKDVNIKVIFISCLGGNELRESMKDELSEELILAKPISEGALLASLNKAFESTKDEQSQDVEDVT